MVAVRHRGGVLRRRRLLPALLLRATLGGQGRAGAAGVAHRGAPPAARPRHGPDVFGLLAKEYGPIFRW